MTSPLARSGRQVGVAPIVPHAMHPPHAALLIDFDNVTMGIRSDLTKELKHLLNSDIIRGKVTVQRAYADWRRYPQYIMPLTERSIDMIWATAVGATKKNATDIRLAIDAIELVFTRPEIGTFIVLSGDSDFSSLVLKLKEYGKYVIGIGIRESASDLLIQNCDEYYSYSELAGLTKESDAPSVQRDPWELVKAAVSQMARQGDVMRSDRLKQVMQQIDSNFDERNAGFNRFSKFVQEAGNRSLLKLTKLDNGQFEVGPLDVVAPAVPVAEPTRDGENGRGRGRGRGRRGRGGEGPRREPAPAAGRPPRAEPAGRGTPPASRSAPAASREGLTLSAAFALLGQALEELGKPVAHDALQARMAALHGREDPLLEPGRFIRFLRQANDADVADVRKVDEGEYEVSMTRGARARTGVQPNRPASEPLAEPGPAPVEPRDRASDERPSAGPMAEPDAAPAAPARTPASTAPAPATSAATLRFRRGSRGGTARPQAIHMVGVVSVDDEPKPGAAVEESSPETPAPRASKKRATSTRSRAAKSTAKAAVVQPAPAGVDAPAKEGKPATKRPSRSRRGQGRSKDKTS